jgi:hypothetical protein
VYSTEEQNMLRVHRAMESLCGSGRVPAGFLTAFSDLGPGRTYADLLDHTVEIDLGDGLKVRVLDLETHIAIREEVGGEKDIAALPVLRRTLAEKRRAEGLLGHADCLLGQAD